MPRAAGGYPPGVATALIHGIALNGASGRHDEYLQALRSGRKEPFTAELFVRSVRPGATVVDGGAYLGFYALLAARRVGPGGTVFAFEPNPETFEVLCRNVHQNGFEERVVPLPAALGRDRGERRFYLADEDGSKSSLFPPRSVRRLADVECTSLDEALGARPVDVVKLDLEGGEVEALRGMRRTLAASPDPCLIVECNPLALGAAGTSAGTLRRELASTGLDVAAVDDEAWELRAPEVAFPGHHGHVNMYCRRT